MLEDEVRLGGVNEAPLDQRPHLGRRAGERGEPARAERAADHRGGLERLLRLGVEQVDASREHSLDRVRDAESALLVAQLEAAVPSLEQRPVEQLGEHLLGEERVALGVRDHEPSRRLLERRAEHAVDQFGDLGLAERVQVQRLAGGQCRVLGPRGGQDEHGPDRVRECPAE